MISGVQHFPAINMAFQGNRGNKDLWGGASAYAQLCERDTGPVCQGQVLVRGSANAGGSGLDGPNVGIRQSSKVLLDDCSWKPSLPAACDRECLCVLLMD